VPRSGVAQSGPAAGPLAADTRAQAIGNGAVNAQLESCGGSSGSCMSLNGAACCMGTSSYEYPFSTGACTSGCTNYWCV
jgi:hypothetical protein